jgi:PAS domain-containing protein
MKVICSYCRKPQPDKEPFEHDRVSHTMCSECYEHYWRQWEGLTIGEYLDGFNAPVLLIDADGRVAAANQAAADRLGKPDRTAHGLLGREAMECIYSRLPEGCGRTVHCETCSVRIAVTNTLETGTPIRRMEVQVTRDDGPLEMTISTEKVDELVRVLIED